MSRALTNLCNRWGEGGRPARDKLSQRLANSRPSSSDRLSRRSLRARRQHLLSLPQLEVLLTFPTRNTWLNFVMVSTILFTLMSACAIYTGSVDYCYIWDVLRQDILCVTPILKVGIGCTSTLFLDNVCGHPKGKQLCRTTNPEAMTL